MAPTKVNQLLTIKDILTHIFFFLIKLIVSVMVTFVVTSLNFKGFNCILLHASLATREKM